MKTLTMLLGSLIVAAVIAIGAAVIVVGLTCNTVHAQDEAAIISTNQLTRHHDVPKLDEEDDDLYAVLKGTSKDIKTDKPLPVTLKGPQKGKASSVLVKQDASLVEQSLGVDLYGAAVNHLIAVANPDSYQIAYVIFTGSDTLVFGFQLENGSVVPIYVNTNTAEAYMDAVMESAISKTRTVIAEHMSVDSAEVHINGISQYTYFVEPGSNDPVYNIDIRVGQFKVGIDYIGGLNRESRFVLRSFISIETGADLYANAIDNLRQIANPDTYTLSSWQAESDGRIVFSFSLQADAPLINIVVDPVTGTASFQDSNLSWQIISAREQIANNMGLGNIENVHINAASITYIEYGELWYGYRSWPPEPASITTIGARVDNYSLTLSTKLYGPWYIDLPYSLDSVIDRPIYKPLFTLTSFVDTATGVDYVAEAGNAVISLLNPEDANAGISYWSMANGKLILYVDPHQPRDPWHIWIGSPIAVEVDLATGAVTIDPVVVDMVTRTRDEITQNTGTPMADVHINCIWQYFIQAGDIWLPGGWNITAATPNFIIGYTYGNDGSLTLDSLYGIENGIDLYAKAISRLIEVVNPEGYALQSWLASADGATFSFNLPGQGVIQISVNSLGVSWVKPHAEAFINTREEIGSRLGLPLEEVHITGYQTYNKPTDDPYTIGAFVYRLTATAAGLTIVMDCEPLISIPENPRFALTLVSITNAEGIDLYANAVAYLNNVFAPDSFTLAEWSPRGDNMFFRFVLPDGSAAGLYVNATTGDVRMKPDANAFIRTREEIAVRLGVTAGEVHVNGYQMLFKDTGDPYMIGAIYYQISARVNDLNVVIECTPNLGKPGSYSFALVSLVNRTTGIDLYANAVGFLTENGQNDFALSTWDISDGLVNFTFTLQDGSIIKVEVNIATGEPRVPQTDLYDAAKDRLVSIVNPEWQMLEYVTFIGANTLAFGFNIGDSVVEVYVNTAIGLARMDPELEDNVLKVRGSICEKLGVNMADVKVTGIEYLMHIPENPQPFEVTARVGNLTITMGCQHNYPSWIICDLNGNPVDGTDQYIDGWQEWTITLRSLVNTDTGIDLYKNAIDCLVQNGQDGFTLTSWGAGDGILEFAFTLEDGSIVSIEVNIATGEAVWPGQKEMKAADLAIKDIAARLRVASSEIRPVEVRAYTNDPTKIYYEVVLDRETPPYQMLNKSSGIVPQPYGRYTYTIRETGFGAGSTQFVIDKVGYFDGSYDIYRYTQVESYQGTVLNLNKIDQYNHNGLLRAEIFIDINSGNIERVVHYKYMGDLRYVDEYQYYVEEGMPGETNGTSVIMVRRYGPEVRIPEAEPLCTFRYEGVVPGQERLVRCTFQDGRYITYYNDLAQAVYTADGRLEASFMYHYDEQAGGIIETRVTIFDENGDPIQEDVYQGLVDAVDLVLESVWVPYEPNRVYAPDSQDPQAAAAQNQAATGSNPPANQPMPDWIKELLKEVLAKNGTHAKSGGSKNVHTYDQMASASNSDGLALRWKR